MCKHLRNSSATREREQGFTLVELSIVLVIIGLIVGGVLVGQDLIKGAEIRATVAQIEKYNASVNTFRGKFNGIPGDLLAAQATAFGLNALSGANGLGDGDGTLEGSGPTVGAATVGAGETTQFWRHLTEANIIDGSFDGSQAAGTVDVTFPRTKIGRNGIGVFTTNGLNYYQIGVVSSAAAAAYTTASSLTPPEAYQIDTKMDDGKPNTGQVMAMAGTALNTVPAAFVAGTDCTTAATTAATYYVAQTNVGCQLRLRMN